MIPGFGGMDMDGVDDNELVGVEAIIQSMTIKERRSPDILNGSRKRRVARGSGTRVQDVNQLLRQFRAMRKMMKQMDGGSMGGLLKMLGQ